MGDRSAASVVILTEDPEKWEAAHAIVLDHGFDQKYVDEPPSPGVELFNEEVGIGIAGDMAPELAAVGVAFRICQDGKYEYDAEVAYGQPGQGWQTATGDQAGTGEVLVPGRELDGLVADLRRIVQEGEDEGVPMNDVAAVADAIDRLTLADLRRAFDEVEVIS